METPLPLRPLPPRPHPLPRLLAPALLGDAIHQPLHHFPLGVCGERIAAQTKTSERGRRGDGVPFAAPQIGVTGRDWGAEWLRIRDGILPPESRSPDFRGTGLVSRGDTLFPIKASNRVSVARMREILFALGVNMSDAAAITDHSTKVTTLSWGSKRGFSAEVLAYLGDHSQGSGSRVRVIYGRDVLEYPFRFFRGFYIEIKEG